MLLCTFVYLARYHATLTFLSHFLTQLCFSRVCCVDVEAVRKRFPFRYEASMNVVLVQEAARYNRLLVTAHESLDALNLALKGEAVTTAPVEAALDSILCNSVPATWSARAFPSRKPLSSWVEDLGARTQMLDEWAG